MNRISYKMIAIWIVLALINVVSLFISTPMLFFRIANMCFGAMNIMLCIGMAGLIIGDGEVVLEQEEDEEINDQEQEDKEDEL